MPSESFDYPLGIRLWPRERQHAQFLPREGYTFSLLENSSDSYRFTALAGAAKISSIFQSFAQLISDEAFFILEFYDQETDPEKDSQATPSVYYSSCLTTAEIMTTLEPFLPRLIHDGFVGFGLANNRLGMELFYSEEKVLTCFTGSHLRITNLLNRYGLPYLPDLTYPTDFGHDHLSLLCLPEQTLPENLQEFDESDLDYLSFCNQLIDLLDMYPVDDSFSFYLSKKEQDQIENRLAQSSEFSFFAEEDFGSLLLDWNDFVCDCEDGFEGDLWEYREGLKLRDMVQFVVEGVSADLGGKILEIVAEADDRFQKNLTDRRKRLDPPQNLCVREDSFWYRGVVSKQGAYLRRDLIRQGWFKP